jgi:hypothetical protein
MVRIEVVEYELACPRCGEYKTQVPIEAPRPMRCLKCFLPVRRTELRRYCLAAPLPTAVGSEAWIG